MDDPAFTVLDTKESRTARFVSEFVRNSEILPKVFGEEYIEVIKSRGKAAKDIFIKLLEYEKLIGQRGIQSKD